jgi:cyanophycin synthetase
MPVEAFRGSLLDWYKIFHCVCENQILFMKITEVKLLKGPNFWSIKRHKLVQLTIDLEELEQYPTNSIPGFKDRLQQLLPSLYEHKCSEGVKGGFFLRVERGTWMGHVVEHVAIELQRMSGLDVEFGQTRGTGKMGIYHVVFEYDAEEQGRYAAEAAFRIVQSLIHGDHYDLQKDISEITRLWLQFKPGPTTASLIKEAKRRNIPVLPLDNDSLIQFGYGSQQKRIEAAITSLTSSIAVDLAGDKERTKKILSENHLPVPEGSVISELEHLEPVLMTLGFPLVIKPLDGNHGKGASVNVLSKEEAIRAYNRAKKYAGKIIVEKCIPGKDHRVLVINKKFIAASLRTPAMVTGDGRNSISELVKGVNENKNRGSGHEKSLTRIEINDVALELLTKNGLDPDTILPMGKKCYLQPTANLSTGGTSADVTDEVHSANIKIFERVARTIGLDICGIDVISPDLSTPLKENGGAIIEVNAAPGFRMHLEPTTGKPRNVAEPVLDMLFPLQGNGRIPIVAITGTNGKTTTTRLVAHMAMESGLMTGFTSTDGIYLGDDLIMKGDCSGPQSARFVLQDPCVEFAVLETARGGILRSGLGFDWCDTAIVTNVAEDHLGLDGIDTIEKLAKVKAVLPETVMKDGYAILNADDDRVFAMKDQVHCNLALFSLYSYNYRIEEHCNNGGLAAYLENGYLIIRQGDHIMPVEEVRNVPITLDGKAEFNISNILAAILAAYTHRIKISTIRKTLQNFLPSTVNTPGRINLFEFRDFTVMLDYAHNPHGVKALGKLINKLDAEHKVGVITGVGDRRDEDIINLAKEAAMIFDEIIIKHDSDLRGRTHEEIDQLLTAGIQKIYNNMPVTYTRNECDATEKAIRESRPGSLIVVLVENFHEVEKTVQNLLREEKEILRKAV